MEKDRVASRLKLTWHESSSRPAAMVALHVPNVACMVIYDIVKTNHDIQDDCEAGVKSVRVRFGSRSKLLLARLVLLQVALLLATGVLIETGFSQSTSKFSGTLVMLEALVWSVNLHKREEGWCFLQRCAGSPAGAILSGLLLEYLRR